MNATIKQKRRGLIRLLQGVLNGYAQFNYAERLRKATFNSASRSDRVAVMGDPTAYCEVIWSGITGEGDQLDAVETNVLQSHNFRVNIWTQYRDAQTYDESSQAEFDELCEDVITAISETDLLPNDDGLIMLILASSGLQATEVNLDNEGAELAHFLTFNISIR